MIRETRRESESRQVLARRILPAENTRTQPTSYFVWIEMPESWTAAAFTARAQSCGVEVYPSDLFAVDPEHAVPAVRLVIGARNRVVWKQQLETLAALLHESPPQRAAVP
jgi:DNA-binding transcriptional MocR family regulator